MPISRKHEGGSTMTSWTKNDLGRIGVAEELQLASFKEDGTLRKPVTIWVVRVGDDLYVRAYRGRETAWFHHIRDSRIINCPDWLVRDTRCPQTTCPGVAIAPAGFPPPSSPPWS